MLSVAELTEKKLKSTELLDLIASTPQILIKGAKSIGQVISMNGSGPVDLMLGQGRALSLITISKDSLLGDLSKALRQVNTCREELEEVKSRLNLKGFNDVNGIIISDEFTEEFLTLVESLNDSVPIRLMTYTAYSVGDKVALNFNEVNSGNSQGICKKFKEPGEHSEQKRKTMNTEEYSVQPNVSDEILNEIKEVLGQDYITIVGKPYGCLVKYGSNRLFALVNRDRYIRFELKRLDGEWVKGRLDDSTKDEYYSEALEKLEGLMESS